jgi:hypothetical protein
MLIRAQDGKVYNRSYITEIAVGLVHTFEHDEDGFKADAPATRYVVEAIVAGKDVPLKEVPLTSQLIDEEQAVAVIDRIMAHKDGNLDLTKEPASTQAMSF